MREEWKIQGSNSWLEKRKKSIGASDVPTIMGENPYQKPYQLFLEKTGKVEVIMNHHMERGRRLEPVARSWYEKKTGISMNPDVMVHPDHPWFMASLDGINEDIDMVLEIKCPSKYFQKQNTKEQIPVHYYGQVQAQLSVTGCDEADFVCYCDGDGFIVNIKRDQEYIDRMIPKLKQFHNWIMAGIYPDAPTEVVGQDLKTKLELTREAKEMVEKWKKQYENLKAELINNNPTGLRSEYGNLVKSTVKGAVDYSKIPDLDNVDLDKYRKDSRDQWTLTFKKLL